MLQDYVHREDMEEELDAQHDSFEAAAEQQNRILEAERARFYGDRQLALQMHAELRQESQLARAEAQAAVDQAAAMQERVNAWCRVTGLTPPWLSAEVRG